MAARFDAELEAVPRADDAQVALVESEAGGGALLVQNLAHRWDNQALAYRPGLMRASIFVGIKPPFEAKYSDGFPAGIHHQPASFGNIGTEADRKFLCSMGATHVAARHCEALHGGTRIVQRLNFGQQHKEVRI